MKRKGIRKLMSKMNQKKKNDKKKKKKKKKKEVKSRPSQPTLDQGDLDLRNNRMTISDYNTKAVHGDHAILF